MGTVTLTINNAGSEFAVSINVSGAITRDNTLGILKRKMIENITSVTIDGDDTTTIWKSAFKERTNLESVKILNGVTTIESWAFGQCTGLTFLEIPEGLTEIGDYAFVDCPNLISITIPRSVISIGDSAFKGCTGLTFVEIPEGVASIEINAFMEIYNMVIVHSVENKDKLKNSIVQCEDDCEPEAEFAVRKEIELNRIFCLENDLNTDEHLIDYNTYQQLPPQLQIIFTQCLVESREEFNDKKEHTFDKNLLAKKILSASRVGVPSNTEQEQKDKDEEKIPTEQALTQASKILLYYAQNINTLAATSHACRREAQNILHAGESKSTEEGSTSPKCLRNEPEKGSTETNDTLAGKDSHKRPRDESEKGSTDPNDTSAGKALCIVAQHLLKPN